MPAPAGGAATGGRRSSRLLFVLDVADDVGHVLVAFLLLLDEGGIVHALIVLDLDLVVAAFGRLAIAGLLALALGIRLLERDELGVGGLRCHRRFFLGGGCGGAGRYRLGSSACAGGGELQRRMAFRADDR